MTWVMVTRARMDKGKEDMMLVWCLVDSHRNLLVFLPSAALLFLAWCPPHGRV